MELKGALKQQLDLTAQVATVQVSEAACCRTPLERGRTFPFHGLKWAWHCPGNNRDIVQSAFLPVFQEGMSEQHAGR